VTERRVCAFADRDECTGTYYWRPR
jgi:hypothetical protein